MRRSRGTTLIETVVGIGIIGTVIAFVFGMIALSNDKLSQSKSRVLATALANEQIEVIRNAPFSQVGTQAPTCEVTGPFPRATTAVRSHVTFTVDTCVRWVDDPFDKLVTDSPPDTVPTDYKFVEVTVSWPKATAPVTLTTTVAPKGLESPSNTASLLVHVIDASGTAVPDADVFVTNTVLAPSVNIASSTDVSGNLQLLALAPDADNNYHVRITKAGYSTDQTYPVTVANPNPIRRDLSMGAGSVTELTFAIDRVSSIAFTTQDEACHAVPDVGFTLRGQKLIGDPPPSPVLKYDQSFTTNGGGQVTVSNLEWDQYALLLSGATRNIAGIIPPTTLNVLPNTTTLAQLILSGSYSANSLLATVKDANTDQPLSDATITIAGVGTKTTGQGSWTQTDWAGGSGQADYTDATRYSSDDGSVEVTDTAGQITLERSTGSDAASEDFTTTTARDPVTTAVWDTSAGELRLPQAAGLYDASAFAQSLELPSPVGSIVTATLTATDQANDQTIRYSLSADGTTFEEVTPGVPHTFAATGDVLRFLVDLGTTDPAVTPTVQDLTITMTVETYAASGDLTSSSFDTGVSSTFVALSWQPESQPAGVGADAARFQLAVNDDNATWDFVGPDGTAGTFFTTNGDSIPVSLDGHRYVRYKLFLQTDDRKFTPGVSDVSVKYTSGCVPPGQAFFPGLSATTYSVTITRSGYEDLVVDVDISGNVMNTFALTPT